MKTQYIVLSLLFVFAALFTVHAQKARLDFLKKENIQVWGECGMCKKKIENAAKNAGAITAGWNEESKMLAVTYDRNKASTEKIEQAVAAAGYDTKDVTATVAAYSNLPECCHYQRKDVVNKVSLNCCNDQIACSKDAGCCKNATCNKDNSACKDMAACKEKECCKS